MIPTLWLVSGAVGLVALQLATVLLLTLRNALVERRLRRRRRRSAVLEEIYESLGAESSPTLRRELARARILRDVESLQIWLDLVVSRGGDPALLDPSAYEESGLVGRYEHALRHSRRWTRRAAAAAILGWTHSPAAAGVLLETVRDVHGECVPVRSVALRAMGRIRHPDVVEPLLEYLDSPEPWLPPAVANILRRVGAPAVGPLCTILDDPGRSVTARRWAAQILGEIGHGKALVHLQSALADADAELRAKAAKALGSIGDGRSVDLLLDHLLVDPIPFVRASVAKALAQLSGERVVEFLVEALADPEWWVRLRAVEGLAHVGAPAVDILLGALHDKDPQVARETARALESLGVVGDMLGRLRKEGYHPEVVEFLIDVGKAGNLEPLLDELESGDVDMMRAVVRCLARIGDPRAAPALAALLDRHDAPALQARVVDALRRVGAAEYVDDILPLLRSENEWVRKIATDYLAAFADASVLATVLPLLEDENPWTRESSLRLVGRLRPPTPLPESMVAALGDPVVFVRAQAVHSLCLCEEFALLRERGVHEELGEEEIREALLKGLAEARSFHCVPLLEEILPRLGEEQLDRLHAILSDAARHEPFERVLPVLREGSREDVSVARRWIAATLLHLLPTEEHREALRTLLEDPDPRVRAAAISLRGEIELEDPALRERVVAGLTDDSPLVIRGAIRALAGDADASSEAPLVRLVRHEDVEICVDAALALAFRSTPTTLRAIRAATAHREAPVRLAAVVALVHRRQPEALLTWLHALKGRANRAILTQWGDRRHPLLAEILRQADDPRASLGRSLLLSRTTFEAEQRLIEELSSSPVAEIRKLAIEGLAALDSGGSVGRIFSTYRRDPSPEVRMVALRTLVQRNVYGRRHRFLEMAFQDPVESIQVTAAHLTVLLDDEEALPLLTRLLVTRRPLFLDAVTDLLAGRLEDGVEPLVDLVMGMEPNPELLQGFIKVLAKAAPVASTEVLQVLLEHRWSEVRAEALRALLPRRENGAMEQVLRALDDPSPRVREAAIRLLGGAGAYGLDTDDPRLERALLEATRDPSPVVRSRAALAVGRAGMRGARSALQRLRKDEHRRVVRAAERGLAALDARRPEEVPA